MKSILPPLVFVISALLFVPVVSCRNNGHSILKPQTITELKNELRTLEIDSAVHLLEMSGKVDSLDKGLLIFHDYEPRINLVLKSNACVARLKDVTVAIDFISKTGSKIGEKQITVYEYIEPNNVINFKEKIELPDQTERVELRLLNVVGE